MDNPSSPGRPIFVRALFHPAIEDVPVESILHALADPVRVAIFAQIAGSNCTRPARISPHERKKHSQVDPFPALQSAAGGRFDPRERRGVEMHNTSRCAELERAVSRLGWGDCQRHKLQSAGKDGWAGRKAAGQRAQGPEQNKSRSNQPTCAPFSETGRNAKIKRIRRGSIPAGAMGRTGQQRPAAVVAFDPREAVFAPVAAQDGEGFARSPRAGAGSHRLGR